MSFSGARALRNANRASRRTGQGFLRRVKAIAQAAEMNPAEPGAASLLKTFQRRQLSGPAAGRLFCAMDLLETLRTGDRTIVFAERIEQAEQLAAMIRRRWGKIAAGSITPI